MHENTDSLVASTPAAPAAGRALQHRLPDWRAFAAAAGATLAATSAADAAIIYVDPVVKPTAALNTGEKPSRSTAPTSI